MSDRKRKKSEILRRTSYENKASIRKSAECSQEALRPTGRM